jgi:DNA polymerase-1
MRHLYLTPEEQSRYPVCFLVPTIRQDEIRKTYIDPFPISPEEVLVLDLHYNQTSKKTPMKEMRHYIQEELQPIFNDLQTEYIVVTDSDYFKAFTKVEKTDRYLGYVLDSTFGPQKVIYVPNYRAVFYDPEKITSKIRQGMQALLAHKVGVYQPPGDDIIKFAAYPKTTQEISDWLEILLRGEQPLTIDIEGFSLKHHKAGIGSIAFAWNQHEGISFAVDPSPEVRNEEVRTLLKSFFKRFKQKAIYHHIAFDTYVLIYQLFMRDILDTEGLLEGMDVLLRDWDCTKLITYLATNSCAGNKLSLKDQAQSFAGNYAVESIDDITKIPLDKLLQYNLVDALSTWYVYDKHHDTMVADQQEGIYEEVFKPATLDIIQMQLTGLPVNMETVKEVKATLQLDEQKARARIQASPLVQRFIYRLNEKWVATKNATLKKKRVTLADARETFNPASAPQLQDLLYQMLGLPVIGFTDTKQPSTKAAVLHDLTNHTQDPEILELLDALQDLGAVSIMLETFIPAFENAAPGPDGWHYLFGNFNLGGTLSGRLSSSDPNLQNLPANSKYAKLIKKCVEAITGWLYVGLDFNSLEDKISGLTTRDPNKLKVYVGHTVFELEINGVIHHIRDDATVVYDGRSYTGEEFYAAYSKI